jgi:hypothetical protein
MLLPALALAIVTIVTKLITGAYAARLAGVGTLGQWRAGLSLAPRGEFSIVIAGIAVAAGVAPAIAPLATGYVLITIIAGTFLARLPDAAWFRAAVRRRAAARTRRPARPDASPTRRGRPAVGARTASSVVRVLGGGRGIRSIGGGDRVELGVGRVGGREQLANTRHDHRAVPLDAAHHRLVRERAVRVLHVEPARADRAHRGGDLLRDRLGRSGVQGAVRSRLVLEVLAGDRPPAALAADAIDDDLVVRPERVERLLVGVGDVAGRVDRDRLQGVAELPEGAAEELGERGRSAPGCRR